MTEQNKFHTAGKRLALLMGNEDIDESTKGCIEDIIIRAANETGLGIASPEVIGVTFPVMMETSSTKYAAGISDSIDAIVERCLIDTESFCSEVEEMEKRDFGFHEKTPTNELKENEMTEQNNTTPTTENEQSTPEQEKAALEKMLDFMPQYRPNLLAAKLDYLINGERISEDFQRALMILIDEEMINLGLSCGQPELIYHSFPFLINELTEQKGAAEAYQLLQSIERLTFDYTFNNNDFIKHRVHQLRSVTAQSLVLTMVSKCRDDESKVAFLKAYMSLECGEEDLNKQFDLFKELFGWDFSKADVMPDEKEETVLDLSAHVTPEDGCIDLAKNIHAILHDERTPTKVHNALQEALDELPQPSAMCDTVEYIAATLCSEKQ